MDARRTARFRIVDEALAALGVQRSEASENPSVLSFHTAKPRYRLLYVTRAAAEDPGLAIIGTARIEGGREFHGTTFLPTEPIIVRQRRTEKRNSPLCLRLYVRKRRSS